MRFHSPAPTISTCKSVLDEAVILGNRLMGHSCGNQNTGKDAPAVMVHLLHSKLRLGRRFAKADYLASGQRRFDSTQGGT